MKIVVPLDLSHTAARAIEPATEIARGLGDEILLVTVGGIRLRSELRDVAETEHTTVPEMIEAYLKSATAEVHGIPVDHRVISGDDASEALVQFAAEDDAVRMVVIATHGRSGVERWRLGSVAERVVRHTPVPVLVIPAHGRG